MKRIDFLIDDEHVILYEKGSAFWNSLYCDDE